MSNHVSKETPASDRRVLSERSIGGTYGSITRETKIWHADKIIVLNEGKLVEEGTHEALLAKKGLFARLFGIQQESLGWSV